MSGSDLPFFQRRLAEERAREAEARSQAARSAHRLLADSYQERLDELTGRSARQATG